MADNDQILQELKSINNRLGGLEKGQARLEEGQKRLEQGQAHHQTALEVLGAGHQDLIEKVKIIQETQKTLATAKDVDFTVEAAKRDIQADINAATAHLIRQVHSNTKRITALEEHTGAENPEKH
jgi:predicted nuclease with TOPRIM domain